MSVLEALGRDLPGLGEGTFDPGDPGEHNPHGDAVVHGEGLVGEGDGFVRMAENLARECLRRRVLAL